MFESLKEKIEYEFNRFTNGKLCESRRSIFTASNEIEVKKMIRARLVQGYAMDTEAKLLEIPDLLDAVYQELTIHGQEPYTHVSANEAARKLNMSEATFQRKFEASSFFQGKTLRRKTNAR